MKIPILAFVSLLFASTASAQLLPGVTVAPGSDVRLTLAIPSDRVRGKLERVSADSVWLARDDVSQAFPFRNVRRFQVRGGEDKRKGFLIGASIFGGVTLVAGGIDYSRDRISGDDYAGTVLLNILIGGLVGYAFAPRGWIDLPMQP